MLDVADVHFPDNQYKPAHKVFAEQAHQIEQLLANLQTAHHEAVITTVGDTKVTWRHFAIFSDVNFVIIIIFGLCIYGCRGSVIKFRLPRMPKFDSDDTERNISTTVRNEVALQMQDNNEILAREVTRRINANFNRYANHLHQS